MTRESLPLGVAPHDVVWRQLALEQPSPHRWRFLLVVRMVQRSKTVTSSTPHVEVAQWVPSSNYTSGLFFAPRTGAVDPSTPLDDVVLWAELPQVDLTGEGAQ